MLITSRFMASGDLEMDAYTFDQQDFSALEDTLSQAGALGHYERLPDRVKKEGRRYYCPAHALHAFEVVLEGKFQASGLFVPAGGTGNNYKCKEVDLLGFGLGCEDVIAPNSSIARTKCALIANRNN